jgi:hypothetical protein
MVVNPVSKRDQTSAPPPDASSSPTPRPDDANDIGSVLFRKGNEGVWVAFSSQSDKGPSPAPGSVVLGSGSIGNGSA